jgi:hypothetical protein
MNTDEMWLDDRTLRHLKSLSKKLVSPDERVVLTQEEVGVVQKIRNEQALPGHIIKHFLANGLPI